MTDAEPGHDATLFPGKAGERLREAREAHGLSLAEVAARTRVPLRHLEALEKGSYDGLPSPTYAIGFARAYARVVGVDEVAVARDVRAEVAATGRRQPAYEPYVTADPARVPSRAVAIVAAGVALALLVLGALYFATMYRGDTGSATTTTAVPEPATAPTGVPLSVAVPVATGGKVTLTATDDVWLRVYDAADATLYLGVLKPGESYTVPADANRPMINVGRPDKLTVTLDGRAIPALGKGDHAIKDVPVSGAAIAARLAAAPAPDAAPSPTPSPSASPTAHAERHRETAHRTRDESETERANRSSARAARRGEAPPVPAAATTAPAAAPTTPP